ncbi:purple acid phosphatase family protein [Runella rosea]|nr:metallophosphoesterase family protein [Runella rosea]
MKTFSISLGKFFFLFLITIISIDTLAQTTFVPFKSTGWKYRTSNQEPATFGSGTWKTNAYSDAAWASGQATLGYEDGGGGTPTHPLNTWVWPYSASRTGTNSSKTHYFRKTFNVGNFNDYTAYRIKTWCDDGLVAYLNGREIFRLNMPATTIDSLTSAVVAPPNDSIYKDTTVYIPTDLLNGTNIIAVEVHQAGNSIDRYFDLSIEGITAPTTCPEWPVAFKSTGWKYRTANQEPTTFGNGTWKTNAYSDAAWASGQATLGYDDGTPTHIINTWVWPYSASRTGNNSSKTHYFRKCFNITDKSTYTGYRIKTWCDDGLVAYLNGREIFRLNMPATTIDSLTSAIVAPPNDSIYKDTTVYIPADLLNGTNVIAVEVHQSGSSIDRYFDLSIEGVGGCPSATLVRQPYLQIGTPTSVIVRWKTNVATNSKVKYGTDPNNLNLQATLPATTVEHIVPLTGLSPNTKYYYSVGYTCGMAETTLASGTDYYYYSMPNNNTTDSLRLWILGDVCSNNPLGLPSVTDGTRRQVNVRNAYMNYLGNKRLHGILFGGDNSKLEGFDGTDTALDYNLFPVYPNQFRNTVSWISLGNHDYGYRPYADSTIAGYNAFSYPTLAEAGGVPSASKGYYSFDLGDVHIIMLNPYHPDAFLTRGAIPGCTGGGWLCLTSYPMSMFLLKFDDPANRLNIFNQLQQVKWLKADLAATTKKWKIVLFHTPPYTKGTHDSDAPSTAWDKPEGELKIMRELLVPVLEQYKVDLIVTSHTHAYDRSFLMQGVTGTPTQAQFRSNPSQLLQNWSGTYGPSSKPYIKNSPYNGAVHVVTGNAGRGATPGAGDGKETSVNKPHPVMFYSDSTDALLSTGGSVELVINQNRLDVRYLKLVDDNSLSSTPPYTIKDQFTIMKDVNKKTTYNNPTLPLNLTASWEGNYSWKILGGGSLPNTTKGITVSPVTNTTYIVNDGYNGGNGFLADTFIVIVNNCPPTITLNTTIPTSTVYQASQWIKGTNTNIITPSATVEYRAGYIELKPTGAGTAFLATPSSGHYFLAVPVGCNPGGGGSSDQPSSPTQKVSEGIVPPNTNSIKKKRIEP